MSPNPARTTFPILKGRLQARLFPGMVLARPRAGWAGIVGNDEQTR